MKLEKITTITLTRQLERNFYNPYTWWGGQQDEPKVTALPKEVEKIQFKEQPAYTGRFRNWYGNQQKIELCDGEGQTVSNINI